MINNVVIVSGEELRDSAICIHVSIFPQTPLPSRLKLGFLMCHCRKNSVRDKVIGKKWIYSERNTPQTE